MFTSTSFYWYMSPFVTDKDDTQHWWEQDSCVPRCETPGLTPYKDTDEARPGGALLEVQTLTSWWAGVSCDGSLAVTHTRLWSGLMYRYQGFQQKRNKEAEREAGLPESQVRQQLPYKLHLLHLSGLAQPSQLAAPPRSPCGSSRK